MNATTFNLGSTLYREQAGQVIKVTRNPNAKVRSTSFHISKKNASAKMSSQMSCVSMLLDMLFVNPSSISIMVDGDRALYVEINGKKYGKKNMDGHISTEPVSVDGIKATGVDMAWVDALYRIIYDPECKEMSAIIAKMVKNTASSEMTQEELTKDAYVFSDCYYYVTREHKLEKYEMVEDLVPAEYIQAYAKGKLYEPALFKGAPGIAPADITKVRSVLEDEASDGETSETFDYVKFLDECKNGEYMVPYMWSQEQSSRVQDISFLDGFIPSPTFVKVLKKIKFRTTRILDRMSQMDGQVDRIKAIGRDSINLTLVGKPGTGKTQLAYALSAATGMPIYTNSCSHNTDEDEFEGKTKIVNGKPQSVPTDGLKCFENGGIFLLEEVNLPQSAVIMGALGQAVEFPYILKKNGYETIRRHPLCIFISTMNTGTSGSKPVSQPFANRFRQSYVMDDPSKDDFINMLMVTGAKRKVCSWIYRAYENVVAAVSNDVSAADTESILLSLSMRSCIGAIENIQEGENPKDAVIDSIIGKIAEQDLQLAETCKAVIVNMNDLVI